MKTAFKGTGKLASTQVVRLTDFYPNADFGDHNVGFEIYRQGHRRPLNALLGYSQDERYASLLAGSGRVKGEGGGEVKVSESSMADLVEIGGVDAVRRLAIDSVIGAVYGVPVQDVDDDATAEEIEAAEVKKVTVGENHPEREELLLSLLGNLPMDFVNACFKRAGDAEKEFTAYTEEMAGKS